MKVAVAFEAVEQDVEAFAEVAGPKSSCPDSARSASCEQLVGATGSASLIAPSRSGK